MITTEREALFVRIERMYHEMSLRFKELNEGEYGQLRYNMNTSLFHECRESLAYEFQSFERNDISRTLEAVKDSNRTSMEEIRDLDQLMMETLSYVGVQPFIPSVEELMNPRGHLIENVDSWRYLKKKDEEKNYWMLTERGTLEFHGGGWLKNSNNDFILDPYGNRIGSDYIESGLDYILNHGLNREKDNNEIISRNDIIDHMLDSGLNYYVSDGKDSSKRENWYWNLTDNERDEYRFLSEEKSERLGLWGKTVHDFTWPVKNATVTSAYGPRPRFVIDHEEIIDEVTGKVREGDPIYSKPEHDGIDITGNHDIISIEKGYVYKMNENPDTFGNNVFIYHGGGISSRYCHLASVSVKEKQIIEKGSKIGVMGTTGHSTGIHLHFEIRSNYWGYKDPGIVLGTAGAGVSAPDVFVSGGTFKNKME